jgi:hypothetical protein
MGWRSIFPSVATRAPGQRFGIRSAPLFDHPIATLRGRHARRATTTGGAKCRGAPNVNDSQPCSAAGRRPVQVLLQVDTDAQQSQRGDAAMERSDGSRTLIANVSPENAQAINGRHQRQVGHRAQLPSDHHRNRSFALK